MAGMVLGLHHERPVELVLIDLDAVEATDLRQQQAEAHPPLGDLLILGLELVVALALVFRVAVAVAAFFFDLLPDRIELAVGHTRRDFELIGLRQGIQQLALELGPGQPVVVALQLLHDLGAQGRQIRLAQVLGQGVVDGPRDGGAHLLDRDREDGLAAGQLVVHVLLGKGDRDTALLPGLGADQLVLEALDETIAAEFEMVVLARHARQRLAVDRALEIDHQHVALFRRARGLERRGLPLGARQALEGLVDLRFGHIDLGPLQLDLGEVAHLDIRQQLDRDLVLEILALLEGGDLDLRLHGRAQAALGERLGRAVAHRLLDDLAHDRLAEALLQDRHRHFARAEAREPHFLADLFEARLQLFAEVLGRNDDGVFALEVVRECFRDLHEGFGLS